MPNKRAWFVASAVLILAGFGAGSARAQVSLDAPAGGWRDSSGSGVSFLQPVYYPASAVNADGQDPASLIRGRITQKAKPSGARLPHTLVVNGVAMPLLADEQGNFARPYAFGAGSNSLEVRAEGKTSAKARRRVQFYETNADRTPSKLRVALSWDSDGTDLDLHVIGPTGEHTFYGDRVAPSGAALDIDVTTGYGPEIYAAPAPGKGAYHVYVNYYGAGDRRDVITIAQVAIITNENTPNEKQQVFRVPMRKPGELTLVRSFVFP